VKALKMKIISCLRHLKCIWRKRWRGMDYSWHVQHLLREFGRGQFADLGSDATTEPCQSAQSIAAAVPLSLKNSNENILRERLIYIVRK
jgi:hypothetical protein